jgi:LPS-assembly lipoprotein
MSSGRLAAAAWFLLLAGCGFHPLYEDHPATGSLAPKLASVRVMALRDRQGQEMVDTLKDALNPNALAVPAAYQLEIRLVKNISDRAVREDSTVSVTDTDLVATWVLRRLADNTVVAQGRPHSLTGHDVLNNEYVNVVSGKADVDRGVRDLSEQIETGITAYFQKPT